jgi:hypothetical protein
MSRLAPFNCGGCRRIEDLWAFTGAGEEAVA